MFHLSGPFIVKAFSGAVMLLSGSYMFFVIGPLVETAYFPVVDKLRIERMAPDGPEKTKIYASFKKLRNCEYIGIAWYRGDRETGFERVPLALLREPGDMSSPNRPVGWQKSGPWIVSIPVDDIETNSFVELFHQCWPLWVSRTEFYP